LLLSSVSGFSNVLLCLLCIEQEKIVAELNARKEAWQAEQESVHQLELQSLQAELEIERDKHSSEVHDLEQKHEEELVVLRNKHELELADVDRQRRSDVAEVKAELEQKFVDQDTELRHELNSVTSSNARLYTEVNDLTVSRSQLVADYELHIAELTQKLDLKCQQHDQEVSKLESRHEREVDSLKADLESVHADYGSVKAELADRYSHQIDLSNLCTKCHGQLTHLAVQVGRLRGEVADVLRRSAVDLRNDVAVVEREMLRLSKYHSSSVSKLNSWYGEEVAYCKDQLYTVQQEHEQTLLQMTTDHQAEVGRIRQEVEESLETRHRSIVADLTDHYVTEVNQLKREIDQLREKCNSLSADVVRYQNELKQSGNDRELERERHHVELKALNEHRDKELSEFQEQKDCEHELSVNSLERKHANEMSEVKASHRGKVDELMEEIERLRFDYGQTVAGIHKEKQEDIMALEDTVKSLKIQNENVLLELEFKVEAVDHLQNQLNILGQEHSRVLQEIEQNADKTGHLQAELEKLQSEKDQMLKEHGEQCDHLQNELSIVSQEHSRVLEEIELNSKELQEWKQLADKLTADNDALVEKNAEETGNLQAELEKLQSAKDQMLREHAEQREEEVARLQAETDAVRNTAEEEVGCLKDAVMSLEKQLSEAKYNQMHQTEQFTAQHIEEKESRQDLATSSSEDMSNMDSNRIKLINTFLNMDIKDRTEIMEQQRLELQGKASELLKLQAAKEAVDGELSAAENQLKEVCAKKEQMENKCTVLSEQCNSLESELDKFGAENEQLKLQLEQEKLNAAEQCKQLESLDSELDQYRDEGDQLRMQVEDTLKSFASLETQLQSVTDQLLAVEQEKQKIVEQKNSIELDLEQEKQIAVEQCKKMESLESKRDKYQDENDRLRLQVEDMLKSSVSLETELQSVTNQLLAAEQENQKLVEQKNSIELDLYNTKELASSLQEQLAVH